MSLTKLSNESTKYIYNYAFGPVRNLILGAGLYYAIKNKYYSHIPIIILFPSIYCGYNSFENKEEIIKWLIIQKNKLK